MQDIASTVLDDQTICGSLARSAISDVEDREDGQAKDEELVPGMPDQLLPVGDVVHGPNATAAILPR